MTWGGENNFENYEEKPRNGCRGLFFAAVFNLLSVAIIVVIVILLIKC